MKSFFPHVRITLTLVLVSATITAQESNQTAKKKPVAGKADVLRAVPKKFSRCLGVDDKTGQVLLQIDGQKETTRWTVQTDAEIKIAGWWGRLDQFSVNDRVWAWFAVDRKKRPKSILMLADETSEKLIHGSLSSTSASLVKQQTAQKERLRQLWKKQGLPGTVTFLHPLGGEMEMMLDHEAMRWGRYLKNGDKVTLTGKVQAVVKHVQPWRERTRLLLVTQSGLDQSDYSIGQRIHVQVPAPPMKVQKSALPTDIGRLKDKKARVEWFLCNTYCTCKVPGDRCTGMFYSLASCNENACGMPNIIRSMVGKMIDKGMSDQEILKALKQKRGSNLLFPHLLK